MATRSLSRHLLLVLVAWMILGSWLLFRPVVDGGGINPLVGHVVVFFFVSLATFGLLWRPLGAARALLVGGLVVVVAAAASEVLQPILTASRLSQREDFLANASGIAGAAVVSGALAVVFRKPSRRETASAAVCLLGLVGSGLFLAIGGDRIEVELACRGSGFEPITAVDGAPIIHVEGQSVRVGSDDVMPLGDGIVAPDSTDLRCSVLRSGEYSIVATVVPESLDSGGPTRIFTSSISTDLNDFNTHIGQDFDELSIRIRSGDRRRWESVPGVFVAGRRTTVAVVVAEGEAVIFVDGEQRAAFELADDSFSSWDPDFVVMVGDEFTRDRTFEGDLEVVSFYDRALAADDPLLELADLQG